MLFLKQLELVQLLHCFAVVLLEKQAVEWNSKSACSLVGGESTTAREQGVQYDFARKNEL